MLLEEPMRTNVECQRRVNDRATGAFSWGLE
jgi:hypothetical protein